MTRSLEGTPNCRLEHEYRFFTKGFLMEWETLVWRPRNARGGDAADSAKWAWPRSVQRLSGGKATGHRRVIWQLKTCSAWSATGPRPGGLLTRLAATVAAYTAGNYSTRVSVTIASPCRLSI